MHFVKMKAFCSEVCLFWIKDIYDANDVCRFSFETN